jgi:hypothetical protein
VAEPVLDWLQFAIFALFGALIYFFKRSLSSLDAVEARLRTLEIDFARMLGRDRKRRLEDYTSEGDVKRGGYTDD